MESLYSSSTANVPKDLTEPTPTYRKHVWLALGGIVLFFVFYIALTFWFFFSAYRLFSDAFNGGNHAFVNGLLGLAVAFLGVFMIKAFFFVQTKLESNDREIKEKDEPLLFDFLYKLADEAGAPRPHKVYLSNRVNACVFYDLSFLNLFFPSKKNLEIGLGLINVLNLGEFKAVLAHEFGHFAQRSMLVGRWVYISNQIANAIIAKRDMLDSFLNGLSSIDIRIAWVGWILSIIVWSIRSLVEMCFRLVILSQRALSREMEFQADLVAVSLTGSDALVHALHKLQAADQAFSSALNSANLELDKKKGVEDIYALQSNAIQKTAWILNDPDYGSSPTVPADNPAEFRVFSSKIAQPPKMWATHPPDQEREANAKKVYIPASIDDKSAWVLFAKPSETKIQMTQDLIKTADVETTTLPTEESLKNQNVQYDRSYFKPKYRGIYLNRFLFQEFRNPEDIYLTNIVEADMSKAIDTLYPESLVADLEDFTSLKEESLLLEAIRNKELSATGEGNAIWHRGVQIRRKELPEVIEQVSQEVEAARLKVAEHDRKCRTVHYQLAQKIGNGWDIYLKGLLTVIHYSEHSISNLNDTHRILANVFNIVIADGRVSSSELRKLLIACRDVYDVLNDIHNDKTKISLDKNLLKELEVDGWADKLEAFTLTPANEHNINDWMNVIDSWVNSYREALANLRSEALEVLLRTEEKVQQMAISNSSEVAPVASLIPADYPVLLPGEERENLMKLSAWDRFATADGLFPAILRFVVAACIVGATVFMVGGVGSSKVSIYNGLSQNVKVNLNGERILLAPNALATRKLDLDSDFIIQSSTEDGQLIETFQPEFSGMTSNYFYNIAGAAALIEWTMYYGGTPRDRQQFLGNDRWAATKVDYLFVEPPESIRARSNTTRDVLTAISNTPPNHLLSLIPEEAEQAKLIRTHAMWENNKSEYILTWLALASELKDFKEILNHRLERTPDEVVAVRALQDYGSEEQKQEACTKYENLSQSNPDNADFYYLYNRCIEDKTIEDEGFIKGFNKWPENGWLAFASGYIYITRNNWKEAYRCVFAAHQQEPALQAPLSFDLERIKRTLVAQGEPVSETSVFSSQLQYYLSLEAGNDPDLMNTPDHAYFYINNGDLELAMTRVQKEDATYTIPVLCLVAASDGAKEEWIEQALALNPEEDLNIETFLPILALASKKNKDLLAYQTALQKMDSENADKILEFAQHTKAGNFKTAEALLKDFNLYRKGQLYAMACIIAEKRAPDSWRVLAKSLLFASERPYFE